MKKLTDPWTAYRLAVMAGTVLLASGFGLAQSPATESKPLAATPAPVSLLEQPAEPATVKFATGKLTVEANNSTLSEILQQVSRLSGMTVTGLSGSDAEQRIFGSYGPGDPHDVLSQLLDGSGFNIVMLGKTAVGTPRELNLSVRGAGVPNGPGQPQFPVQDNDNADDSAPSTQNPAEDERRPPAQAGPHTGVRTPQQMLEELQRMRQQQQQQSPNE